MIQPGNRANHFSDKVGVIWSVAGALTERNDSADVCRDKIVSPPLYEQKTIANFLDRETTRIDTLVTKVQKSIDRLKEHRTALISAAAAGKIDLREEIN